MGQIKNIDIEIGEALEALQSSEQYKRLESSFLESLAGRVPVSLRKTRGDIQRDLNKGGF